MPIVRAQATFVPDSGLPEDKAMNTWHFDSATATGTDLTNILDLLEDFYTAIAPGSTQTVAEFVSQDHWPGGLFIQLYNLDDAIPRPEIDNRFISATPGTGAGLPTEVALCLSFQGDPIAGGVQARRRGRIYLPWLGEDGNEAGTPSNALIGTLARAGAELLAASNAAVGTEWVIWSPTDNASVAVDNGWVDNAWDTQRRRGRDASARESFT